MISLPGNIQWKRPLRASDPDFLKCLDGLQNIVSSSFLCRPALTADVAPNHIIC